MILTFGLFFALGLLFALGLIFSLGLLFAFGLFFTLAYRLIFSFSFSLTFSLPGCLRLLRLSGLLALLLFLRLFGLARFSRLLLLRLLTLLRQLNLIRLLDLILLSRLFGLIQIAAVFRQAFVPGLRSVHHLVLRLGILRCIVISFFRNKVFLSGIIFLQKFCIALHHLCETGVFTIQRAGISCRPSVFSCLCVIDRDAVTRLFGRFQTPRAFAGQRISTVGVLTDPDRIIPIEVGVHTSCQIWILPDLVEGLSVSQFILDEGNVVRVRKISRLQVVLIP